MTSAEYFKEAEARFGADPMNWAFVCPVCGHRQTMGDYKAVGAPETAVALSCVGRWLPGKVREVFATGKGPCNYAGGGLFRLNPVEIEGRENRYFDLAPKEVA